jgi:hypothetical protein
MSLDMTKFHPYLKKRKRQGTSLLVFCNLKNEKQKDIKDMYFYQLFEIELLTSL